MTTLTQRIFEDNGCPYDNHYQGTQKRLVFVCSAGLLRSPTAANVATKHGYNTRSCGSADYALIRLNSNLIEWAHKIVFMNPVNRMEALDAFDIPGDDYWLEQIRKKSVCWNIEDDYVYMHQHLVRQVENHLLDLEL